MNVLTVMGTRPEAIKLAPVIKKLGDYEKIKSYVCVTAQHRHMLDQVLALFKIKVDYDLNIMKPGQNLTSITIEILTGLKNIIDKCKPDIVIVHGDTTTAMAAALAAFYSQVRVIHVEAGLRTGNLNSPWPEEGNRNIISKLAYLHFAPTLHAKRNLIKENIDDDKIIVTGNTVIDSLLMVSRELSMNRSMEEGLKTKFKFIDERKKLILVTGHRRENFGDGFENICKAIKVLASDERLQIVYPVHLNPNVKDTVERILGNIENVNLIDPQDYLPFVYLMKKSHIILTDSGGIQEEGPSLHKPVLVMRNNTERPEAVEAGTVKLVGTNSSEIIESVNDLLKNEVVYNKMCNAKNPYGEGNAAQIILDSILNRF